MKRRINVLIADGNENFCEQLKDILKKTDEYALAGIAADGLEAKKLLQQTHPDILILDLTLSKLDGIALLKFASTMSKPPITVVMSSYVTDYVAAMTANLGAQYFMLKPCDCNALVDRIREIRDSLQQPEQNAVCNQPKDKVNTEEMVTKILRDIGVAARLKGYQYLRKAIMAAVDDPDVLNAITKVLYPQVADAFSTTPSRVERAIRKAIELAWNTGNAKTLQHFFGYSVSGAKGKPTNSEFIALIADKVQLQLKSKNATTM